MVMIYYHTKFHGSSYNGFMVPFWSRTKDNGQHKVAILIHILQENAIDGVP